MLRSIIAGALVAGLAARWAPASAEILTFSFTTTNNHAGSFSVDEGAPGGGPGGNTYALETFVIDGRDYAQSAMRLSEGFDGDLVSLKTGPQDFFSFMDLRGGWDMLSSATLPALRGLTFADLDLDRSALYLFRQRSAITSLQLLPSVPEPGTWGLMALGLAGLGAARLRGRG